MVSNIVSHSSSNQSYFLSISTSIEFSFPSLLSISLMYCLPYQLTQVSCLSCSCTVPSLQLDIISPSFSHQALAYVTRLLSPLLPFTKLLPLLLRYVSLFLPLNRLRLLPLLLRYCLPFSLSTCSCLCYSGIVSLSPSQQLGSYLCYSGIVSLSPSQQLGFCLCYSAIVSHSPSQ